MFKTREEHNVFGAWRVLVRESTKTIKDPLGKRLPLVEVVPFGTSKRQQFAIHPCPHAGQLMEEAKQNGGRAYFDGEITYIRFENPILRWMLKPARIIDGRIFVCWDSAYNIRVEEKPEGDVVLSKADLEKPAER